MDSRASVSQFRKKRQGRLLIFTDQKKYRARKRSPEGTRGAHEARGAHSSLVDASCPFRTTSYFPILLNIPKRRNIAIRTVMESVYLPYDAPIPFRSLKRSVKCPLCIPLGLRSITLVSTFIGLSKI